MSDRNKSNLWQALSLAGQLGYTIAIPLVILALLGRFLDKKFGSSPWFLLGGVLLSLVITSVWIYKKSADIMKEMDADLGGKSEAQNPQSETKKENSNDQNPKRFEH